MEHPAKAREAMDDLDLLLGALPDEVVAAVHALPDQTQLIEVVLDLGRRPGGALPEQRGDPPRAGGRPRRTSPTSSTTSGASATTTGPASSGRSTASRAIRNRNGKVVGLTCRIGKAVFGTIEIIEDFVESGKSILIMGRPGIGKTTMLREAARVLADDLGKRVVVVDTSNEIAGDGDIPHPAIGKARRMQVRTPSMQHEVMIEAVENHMPQVIVIDEIGTELEAQAARTIAERGVQLIGTAHGNNLDNLMLNPTLSDLIGGIQSVTLGDEEARRRRTAEERPRAQAAADLRRDHRDPGPRAGRRPRRRRRDRRRAAARRGGRARASLARRGGRPSLPVAAPAVAPRAARARSGSPASSAAASPGGWSPAGAGEGAYRTGASGPAADDLPRGGSDRLPARAIGPARPAAGARPAVARAASASTRPSPVADRARPAGPIGRPGRRRRAAGRRRAGSSCRGERFGHRRSARRVACACAPEERPFVAGDIADRGPARTGGGTPAIPAAPIAPRPGRATPGSASASEPGASRPPGRSTPSRPTRARVRSTPRRSPRRPTSPSPDRAARSTT